MKMLTRKTSGCRTGAPITVISNCVIGRNCTIGAGVRITNSYIFDDVTIEDDCTIDYSIIANGVVIKSEVGRTSMTPCAGLTCCDT